MRIRRLEGQDSIHGVNSDQIARAFLILDDFTDFVALRSTQVIPCSITKLIRVLLRHGVFEYVKSTSRRLLSIDKCSHLYNDLWRDISREASVEHGDHDAIRLL